MTLLTENRGAVRILAFALCRHSASAVTKQEAVGVEGRYPA